MSILISSRLLRPHSKSTVASSNLAWHADPPPLTHSRPSHLGNCATSFAPITRTVFSSHDNELPIKFRFLVLIVQRSLHGLFEAWSHTWPELQIILLGRERLQTFSHVVNAIKVHKSSEPVIWGLRQFDGLLQKTLVDPALVTGSLVRDLPLTVSFSGFHLSQMATTAPSFASDPQTQGLTSTQVRTCWNARLK